MTIDERLKKLDPPYGTIRYGLWRTFLVAATIAAVAATYYPASALTMDRSVDLMTPLDHAIPFLPWTWWIYFPHYVFGMVVTSIAIRNTALLWRVVFAVVFGQILSASCYFMLPSTFPRPLSVGDADPFTTAAVHWFWGTDPANNTFPSTHVANACIAAIGAWMSGQRVRWYTLFMAIGVFITVHTTKQHYWVDSIGGVILALVAFGLTLRIWPLPPDSHEAQPSPEAQTKGLPRPA